MPDLPEFDAILSARERISPYIHVTPALSSATLDADAQAKLVFKCENFQKVGAFKARGAHNAVFALTAAQAAKGVVTHSSGNHGAAVSLAAKARGIPAWVVVPEGAVASKVAAIERYGAKLVRCEPTVAAREAAAAKVQAETGAHLVHPYNDPWVIAGQGTAALELLEQAPDVEMIVAPISGGGLLSGTALAAKGKNASIMVVGAEPAGADDAARSLAAGHIIPQTNPRTIADGLRSSLGDITFAILSKHADGIITVTEEEIVAAMRRIWEVLKIVAEPSAAVAYAAVRAQPNRFRGKRVGVILSGGNVDLDHLPF